MRSLLIVIALTVLCICVPGKRVSAQKIIVSFENNTAQGIDLTTGTCTQQDWSFFCTDNGAVTSMALIRDTIYFIGGSTLYKRRFMDAATSCRRYVNDLRSDVLTVDRKGTLYWVQDARLIRFNPHLNITDTLGTLPFAATGDMIFYKDKLYLSATGGIVEVNIANPSQSRMVLPAPGREFPGLVNVNDGCSGNKVYAIEFVNGINHIVELDLEQNRFLGTLCSFNMNGQKAIDAASFYETGEPPDIKVSDMYIKTACWPDTLHSDVRIIASTPAGDSDLLYTLVKGPLTISDTPQRGPLFLYHKLEPGTWRLNIRNKSGCTLDTQFTVPPAIRMQAEVYDIFPDTCWTNKGSMTVKVIGGAPPYNFPNRPNIVSETTVGTETIAIYKDLSSRRGRSQIADTNGCVAYMEYSINVYEPPIPLTGLTIIPATGCQSNGQIKLSFGSSVKVLTLRLDTGSYRDAVTHLTGLSPGTHRLELKGEGICAWDTSFTVPVDTGSAPVIRFINKSPDCQGSNGSSTVQVSNIVSPFAVNFNGGGFTSVTQFNNLPAGVYPVLVKDGNGCEWKASDTILPYTPSVPVIDSAVNENRCAGIGSIRLGITGAEAPYRFQVDGSMYNSGMRSVDLAPGTYPVIIYNAMRCVVDTLRFRIREKGDCDTIRAIYVPSAFTPNSDGKNDMLEPLGNPTGKVVRFVFRVYNRSGQVVFETRSPGKGWNGKYKGLEQPAGVYVWVFNGTGSDGAQMTYKGTTLLLR